MVLLPLTRVALLVSLVSLALLMGGMVCGSMLPCGRPEIGVRVGLCINSAPAE